MIGWAKITKAGDSAARWFIQQITYRSKVSKCLVVYPYGFHANAKPDNSLVLMFGVNGDAENKAGITFDPHTRPNLVEGEVAVYQPGSNTLIKFLADGAGIEIINDTQVKIISPEVLMTGNLTVVGDTTLSATVTSNGKDISDTHTHIGSPTAPSGSQSNTGAPV